MMETCFTRKYWLSDWCKALLLRGILGCYRQKLRTTREINQNRWSQIVLWESFCDQSWATSKFWQWKKFRTKFMSIRNVDAATTHIYKPAHQNTTWNDRTRWCASIMLLLKPYLPQIHLAKLVDHVALLFLAATGFTIISSKLSDWVFFRWTEVPAFGPKPAYLFATFLKHHSGADCW